MSTIKVNKIEATGTADGGIAIDTSGHVTVDGQQLPTTGPLSNRSKIINGDMRIDQRENGSAVTINVGSKVYTLDRWHANGQSSDGVFTVERSTTAPEGFTNSLLVSVTTADSSIGADQYYLLCQRIEGYNVADLDLGKTTAKTFTLSFWVRSSVAGTFSGSFENSAEDRVYPFTYTISATNTWEQKTITVAGDTSGTWLTNNGIGLFVWFDLGTGTNKRGTAGAWAGISGGTYGATGSDSLISTNGATFYITGVQLEVGDKATPFEHRSYGDELARCQRYYEVHDAQVDTAQNGSGTSYGTWYFKQTKRNTSYTLNDASGTFTSTNASGINAVQVYRSAGTVRITATAYVDNEL